MSIPFSKGSAVDVSDTPLDVEITAREDKILYGQALQRRARGVPYTYRFRIEKSRLQYPFALPPKYIRQRIIQHLKGMNIRAYDAGLHARQARRQVGLDVE